MSQNFNVNGNGDQFFGPSSDQSNNDFQSLMNSLLSPVSPISVPGYSSDLWPTLQAWQNLPPGGTGFGLYKPQDTAKLHRNAQQFSPDLQEDASYVSPPPNLAVDPQSTQQIGGVTTLQEQAPESQRVDSGQNQKRALDKPSSGPLLNNNQEGSTKISTTDSKKRAAELRAKLLAKRASSAAPTPASKANGAAVSPHKPNPQGSSAAGDPTANVGPKEMAGVFSPLRQNGIRKDHARTASNTSQMGGGSEKSGMSADIEHLFAEAKSAAVIPAGKAEFEPSRQPEQDGLVTTTYITPAERSRSTQDAEDSESSSSDEEGEIRGSTQPTSVDQVEEPVRSIENGRDTTTDSQEKMIRQTETQLAYQTLKKIRKMDGLHAENTVSDGVARKVKQTNEADRNPVQKPKAPFKSLPSKPPSQQNRHEVQSRGHDKHHPARQPQQTRRGEEVDNARDTYAHPVQGARRASDDAGQMRGGVRMSREEQARRRKAQIEDNSRAAEEYKRSLDERQRQAPQPRQELSNDAEPSQAQTPAGSVHSTSGHPASHSDSHVTTGDSAENSAALLEQRQKEETAIAAAQYEINEQDIMDWLELTEYFDAEYRNRKLARFRKKRDLERQKAELEQEDLLEQEARAKSARASSAISPPVASASPHGVRRASIVLPQMRPPPLPLRLNNSDVPGNNQGATATASHNHGLALKRLHGDIDPDPAAVPPAEKTARIQAPQPEPSEPSPVTAIKGESHSALVSPAVPFENRYRPPSPETVYRPRSRSPRGGHNYQSYNRNRNYEQRRRASYSPRRSSDGYVRSRDKLQLRTCFHCGDSNHQVNACPRLRVDIPVDDTRRASGYAVSPNYRGRNPKRMPWPYNGHGKGADPSRVSSLTRLDRA